MPMSYRVSWLSHVSWVADESSFEAEELRYDMYRIVAGLELAHTQGTQNHTVLKARKKMIAGLNKGKKEPIQAMSPC